LIQYIILFSSGVNIGFSLLISDTNDLWAIGDVIKYFEEQIVRE
jgi:hypothetical protein